MAFRCIVAVVPRNGFGIPKNVTAVGVAVTADAGLLEQNLRA
jgi:hypothetical protein